MQPVLAVDGWKPGGLYWCASSVPRRHRAIDAYAHTFGEKRLAAQKLAAYAAPPSPCALGAPACVDSSRTAYVQAQAFDAKIIGQYRDLMPPHLLHGVDDEVAFLIAHEWAHPLIRNRWDAEHSFWHRYLAEAPYIHPQMILTGRAV